MWMWSTVLILSFNFVLVVLVTAAWEWWERRKGLKQITKQIALPLTKKPLDK